MPALKKRYLLPLSCTTGFLLLSTHTAFANSVVNTKHNLSVSGTGDIHATSETRVCIFCHTPHHASDVTPLWSRPENTTIYTLYTSSTMTAVPGQPTGYSRLCLSCHDGTVALGSLHGAAIPIPLNVPDLSGRASNLGTNLRNDHPISFLYMDAFSDGELRHISDLKSMYPAIKLENDVNVECTSCHNPHSDPYGKFLVMDNHNSLLCTACHVKTGWPTSSHADAAVSLAGVTGCLNCHDTHSAGGAVRLLKTALEEETCLNCHKPGVLAGAKDIQTEIGKSYHHPVEDAVGVHDPEEALPAIRYHVECADCHNPHQLKDDVSVVEAPFVNGSLKGVKGIAINGSPTVGYAKYEYEVCFRCHAGSAFVTTDIITRQIEEDNIRLCFDPVNPSFHPVATSGKGTSVPSLRPEFSLASRIYCTDCHNSDDSTKAGGAGPNGPHGSDYEPLLIANYETGYPPPQTYSPGAYALCFRCHYDTILLSVNSTFPKHSFHVVTQGIPCSVCHDPHGIPRISGGTDSANAHLINFDINVVKPVRMYNSVARSCTVSCHAINPKTY